MLGDVERGVHVAYVNDNHGDWSAGARSYARAP